MATPEHLSEPLAAYYDSYFSLFGEMPAVPSKRFGDLATVSPEFVAAFENLRAVGFASDVFDVKTT